jgi:hypothetical protein
LRFINVELFLHSITCGPVWERRGFSRINGGLFVKDFLVGRSAKVVNDLPSGAQLCFGGAGRECNQQWRPTLGGDDRPAAEMRVVADMVLLLSAFCFLLSAFCFLLSAFPDTIEARLIGKFQLP